MICGIDEAGRGCLAGPVCAGACILPSDFPFEILNDSKKLSEKKRLAFELMIKEKSLSYGIGWVWHSDIDKINILQASLLAMKFAFEECTKKLAQKTDYLVDCVIVDGTFCPNIYTECKAIPKADSTEPSVMAASILAKTTRDRLMTNLAECFPAYEYEKHKGYPTKRHREICKKIGTSAIQRLSFNYL
ncbi:MAG: ribonuclease HII [Treponemataceae bacterium]